MNRNPTAAFQKKGPRAARRALRDREALSEQACEAYIRERMQPSLISQARQAVAGFKKEVGRAVAIEKPATETPRATKPRLIEQAKAVVEKLFGSRRD